MSSTPSSGQTPRSASGVGSKPTGLPTDAASDRGEPENVGDGDLSEGVSKLARDMAGLKDTFTSFVSQTGDEAAKTVRRMRQTVASQVSSAAGEVADAGSDLAASAKGHAKTFASELEAMARRNPLGTIAGALVVGIVIGMMSRGRS
jgi:ElaB/YqjD/DUF883 family membrane-anchored ribosome-binding protein